MFKKPKIAFLSLFLLFFITRSFILITSPYLYDYEEVEIGTLAKEYLQGSPIPYLDCMMGFQSHQIGMLFNGFIVSFFYKFLGENVVSLKLCWAIFSSITFSLFFLMMKRYFSYRSCIIASLFFIFSPPVFIWYNLTSPSIENLALFLTVGITFLNFKILPFRYNKIWYYAFYGFISGLAVSLTHYSLFILFVGALYQLWFYPRFFLKKDMAVLMSFFFLGLAPWIYINSTYDLEWFDFIAYKMTGTGHFAAYGRFIQFITKILPSSFCFKDLFFIKGMVLNYLYYFLYIILLSALLWVRRKTTFKNIKAYLRDYNNKELFIWFFIITYILTYSFSSFRIEGHSEREYRSLLILYPFLFISAAVWIDKLLGD